MKIAEKKNIRIRTIIAAVFFSILFAIIGIKALHLQVFCGSWLSQRAAKEYEKSFTSSGRRGIIYDTNHREMAVSIDVTSIAVFPGKIKNKRTATRLVAKALKMNRRKLSRKLNSKKPFVWIKRHVTPKEAQAVKDLDIEGIGFIPERSRFYPNKTLAAQILGFSGIDGHGLEGVEFYYDSQLEGATGSLTVLTDALGRGFDAEIQFFPDHMGHNLVLTIDRTVQYITEKALEEATRKYSAKSGMAIVMVPQTGAVLALAHYPFFNPNAFQRFDRDAWRNRAITDPFEPGSTMKIFLAAAALSSGATSPHTIFFCENGAYRIGRNVVHDTHPHGWLSLQQIVKYSSNIGAVKVTEMIGRKTLYQTLRAFGFGTRTGIDCPGETTGSLSSYKRWSKIDAGAISFGQGISVSAIQLVRAVSAIANNGLLMKPYIVQAITDRNGRLIKSFGPRKARRVISQATAGTVRRIMKTVITEGGTGVRATLEGFTVGGKTGTAQKTDAKGTYSKKHYIASFVGFAPVEHPEIAILVIVDEPQGQHYGGIVAAPAFRKIAEETLNYLKIPPENGTSWNKEKLTASRGYEANG